MADLVRFPFTASYRFKCDICRNELAATWSQSAGQRLHVPAAPTGWKFMRDVVICPDHSVEILVDGDPLDE